MLLDDFKDAITSGGYGTSGAMFKSELPTAPDTCIVVAEYQGSAADTFFGTSGINEKPRVQVRVRGTAYDYATPRLTAERIAQMFLDRGAFTINSTRYANVSPIQPPFPLDKDDNNRWVIAVNFDVLKDRSTSTS